MRKCRPIPIACYIIQPARESQGNGEPYPHVFEVCRRFQHARGRPIKCRRRPLQCQEFRIPVGSQVMGRSHLQSGLDVLSYIAIVIFFNTPRRNHTGCDRIQGGASPFPCLPSSEIRSGVTMVRGVARNVETPIVLDPNPVAMRESGGGNRTTRRGVYPDFVGSV